MQTETTNVYRQQKLRIIKGQYEAAESLYQLSLEQVSNNNINQQEVNIRSIEVMATHLTYLLHYLPEAVGSAGRWFRA